MRWVAIYISNNGKEKEKIIEAKDFQTAVDFAYENILDLKGMINVVPYQKRYPRIIKTELED